MPSSVCVIGPLHMNLVVRASRFPRPGETILGESFAIHPGGKGANQAVAASRMGAEVGLVGCIGDDAWGSQLRGVLASAAVDLQRVRTVDKAQTGVDVVTVGPEGEHTVVVAPGADARFGPDDVEEASSAIAAAEVLVLQGAMPPEALARAIELAAQSQTTTLLDASPAESVSLALLKGIDVLFVQREEAHVLVGDSAREVAPTGLARRLASYGPERVVISLGSEGAIHFNGSEMESCEGFPLESVDATAAGDAFVGALAALRAEGARLKDAVRHACAAATLAGQVEGAIPSLPSRDAVDELVRDGVGARG